MWGPLAAQAAAQLDPQHVSSLTAAALWEQQGAPAWPGSAASALQHSPVAPRGLEPGPASSGAWPQGHPESQPAQHHSAAAKIYVQGLPQGLQHPVAVAGLFSPFGDVLDVKLYAAEVRLSGGSAVVRMRSHVQAAAAIAALNGVVPDGGWQQLTVRAAETAEQRSSRITAINGRQQGGGMGVGHPQSPLPGHSLASPSAGSLPPSGPGSAVGAALRRVHSARSGGSQGSLQCYTGGLVGEGGTLPMQRHSIDWAQLGGRDSSMDSSRRSSMDALRSASAAASAFGRCSSDSGSGGEGSGSDEQGVREGTPPPPTEAQRMLLEAVLALMGQVESGQLSMGAMRCALENALAASKQGPMGGDQAPLLHTQGTSNGHLAGQGFRT